MSPIATLPGTHSGSYRVQLFQANLHLEFNNLHVKLDVREELRTVYHSCNQHETFQVYVEINS